MILNLESLLEIISDRIFIRVSLNDRLWKDSFQLFARHMDGTVYWVPSHILKAPECFKEQKPLRLIKSTTEDIEEALSAWAEARPKWLAKKQFVATSDDSGNLIPVIHPKIMAGLGQFKEAMIREHKTIPHEEKVIMELFIARLQGFIEEQEKNFCKLI